MSTARAHKWVAVHLVFLTCSLTLCLVSCTGGKEARWGWPVAKYDKVVGYQFVNYGYSTSSPLADSKGRLTLTRLNEVKRKEAVLSNQQVNALVDAIFIPDKEPVSHAVCYDPHHIFVFYSKGDPVAAFEVCFRCMNSNCRPASRRETDVNYARLTQLCMELGLGTEAPPDQDSAAKEFYRKNKPPAD